MATDRCHVDERLAEIHTRAQRPEPSMSYWKALERASRKRQRPLADVTDTDQVT